MLGFGAMGEFALGQIPILISYAPGTFVGDVGVFLKEQEERTARERKRYEEDNRIIADRRADIERALDGPPIEYKFPKQKPLYRAPNTMPLAGDVVRAQQLMAQVRNQRQEEEYERQLEKLLLDL